jgi:glycosyltransferase involved in cell wall biosynthesis
MEKKLNVLAISYGRNLFDADNIERQRMESCAGELGEYHMVVFTRKSDALSVTHAHNGLVIHPTNSKTCLHMVGDAISIGASLLKKRADQWVLTSQDPFEAGLVGYILSHRYKVKLNLQEHGDFFSLNAWKKESMLNAVRFQAGKWLLRRADTVRVVSVRMEATMRSIGVDAKRIVRLPVRTDDGTSQLGPAVDLHAEYPQASVIILSMARFVSQKNLPLLIKAFAQLYKKNPNALLVLIGEGEQAQKLRDLVAEYDIAQAVIFKKWTDTPQAYIQSADIYALSSNYEGWARVLIEAMLAGTPVVTTDVGCAGEVLNDGVHGYVVPVGDADAFAGKLALLADDQTLRDTFATASKQDVSLTHISPDAYTAAWVTVLQQTLNA